MWCEAAVGIERELRGRVTSCPNAVLAKIGDGGKVCIYTLAETDIVIDVNGYVPGRGSPDAVVPARLLESACRVRRRWMVCSRGLVGVVLVR